MMIALSNNRWRHGEADQHAIFTRIALDSGLLKDETTNASNLDCLALWYGR